MEKKKKKFVSTPFNCNIKLKSLIPIIYGCYIFSIEMISIVGEN